MAKITKRGKVVVPLADGMGLPVINLKNQKKSGLRKHKHGHFVLIFNCILSGILIQFYKKVP
jgi:hypothetical protein